MEQIGTIELGVGSDKKRVLQLIDIVQCEASDNRIIAVSESEEGNYMLNVRNPGSTVRENETMMYLTEESFFGLFYTAAVFMHCRGINFEDKMKELGLDKCPIKRNCLAENETADIHPSKEEYHGQEDVQQDSTQYSDATPSCTQVNHNHHDFQHDDATCNPIPEDRSHNHSKKYKDFASDKKRAMEIAKEYKFEYVGCNTSTFQCTFEDKVLGVKIDFYLSKKTICVSVKGRAMQTLKNQSFEKFKSVLSNIYAYL